MELKGRLLDIARDIRSGEFRISISVKEIPSSIDELMERDLAISLKRWREKRSMTANAYYWVLVAKISSMLGTSQAVVHNWLLRGYGQLEMVDGQIISIMLPDTEEAADRIMAADTYHLRPTDYTEIRKGRTVREYHVLKGSSLYDTKEMATLIDGAVIEAKDLGIETLPPVEIERMLGEYEKHRSDGR